MDEEIKKRFEAIEKRLDVLENKDVKPKEDSSQMQNSIFEEQDGKIILTCSINEKNTKEKIKKIVLLSLLGYKQQLNETEVPATKLRENVAIHEIPLENFGTWVKELIPRIVTKKGKRGSTKVTYKLTVYGEAKAKSLLKEITENETSK